MTELLEAPMAAAEACAPDGGTISMEQAERVALVVKALADPVRLRILHHIAASRCSSVCACHMPEVFGVTQPTLSHHLKKLVEAGLVDKEMRGKWAHFTRDPKGWPRCTSTSPCWAEAPRPERTSPCTLCASAAAMPASPRGCVDLSSFLCKRFTGRG